MIDSLLRKIDARHLLTEEERAVLRASAGEVRSYPARKVFIRIGEELSCSTLLLQGFACRYKDLPNGERQITELHVPGDFADLHSFSLKRLDNSMVTMTPCQVVFFPHERLQEITNHYPRLTRILWFLTNLDAAIHREWEVSLGRRTAIGRIAHLFCELLARLGLVGLAEQQSYALRLTQNDLAECMGLTPVHVNRVLKELRESGLVEFRQSRVRIFDYKGLADIADFDPRYLYLDRRPFS